MKKYGLAVCLIFISMWLIAKGADFTLTEQIKEVSVSNTVWTAIPEVSKIDNSRIAIRIDLDRSCTDQILILFSTSSVAPGVAISSGMAMKESDPPWTFSINKSIYLWAVVDGGSGSESLYYQQYRGKF